MMGEGGGSRKRIGDGCWKGWGLPLFISPSGVQGGVTQCDGCSPDPRPQQTCLMATVSSPDRKRKQGRGMEVGVKVKGGGL